MKRFSDLTQILVFLLFLALGLVLLIALPRRTFSEQENRVLAQPPRFRVSDLASGAFTQGVEDCITDQFPLRDSWISLKSRTERALGKTENNNVFFCREDTLITRFPQPEESTVVSAVRAVNTLAEGTKARVFLALIPSSAAAPACTEYRITPAASPSRERPPVLCCLVCVLRWALLSPSSAAASPCARRGWRWP